MLHANVRLHCPTSGVDGPPPKRVNDSKRSRNNGKGRYRVNVAKKLRVRTIGEKSLMKS